MAPTKYSTVLYDVITKTIQNTILLLCNKASASKASIPPINTTLVKLPDSIPDNTIKIAETNKKMLLANHQSFFMLGIFIYYHPSQSSTKISKGSLLRIP